MNQSLINVTANLNAEGARFVIEAAEIQAVQIGWSGCIAVTDTSGGLIRFLRMDGAAAYRAEVATAKARTAAHFRMSTKDLQNALNGGNFAIVTLPDIIPLEGGVPIIIDGVVVGGIGASGGEADETVAAAGAAAVPQIRSNSSQHKSQKPERS